MENKNSFTFRTKTHSSYLPQNKGLSDGNPKPLLDSINLLKLNPQYDKGRILKSVEKSPFSTLMMISFNMLEGQPREVSHCLLKRQSTGNPLFSVEELLG